MKAVAHFISYIFHPLFIPVYGLAMMMYLPTEPKGFLVHNSLFHYTPAVKYVLLMLFAIFGVIAPGISLLLFKLNKSISSLQLEKQQERTMPIFMMAVYMAALFGFLAYQLPNGVVPRIVPAIALGATIGIGITGFINKYYKISLHLLGMGMWTGAMAGYYQMQEVFPEWVIPAVLLCAGFTGSARLALGAHRPMELLAGFFWGFASLWLTIWLFV
jgi:hypothetical protein